jgi:archaellum component FlaC
MNQRSPHERDERDELTELLRTSLGDRATELLMAELPDPDDEHSHDDLSAGINGLSAHMDQQFAWVRDQFADIEQRFQHVDQRFEQIDQRFEQIDQRFEQVDTRLGGFETRFGGIESSVLVLTERVETNYFKTEALVLREFGSLRGDMITQTRTLFLGIPSMIGAMAVLILGFVEFAISR